MPFSEKGDLWIAGSHRLLCGDCTDPSTIERLMSGEAAALCFTSPPYLFQRSYVDGISDWGKLVQGAFVNLPLAQLLVNLGPVHAKGELNRYWDPWIEWMRSQGWLHCDEYIWFKLSGFPGKWPCMLAPAHEYIQHLHRRPKAPNKTVLKHPASVRRGRRPPGMRNKDGSHRQGHVNAESFLATHKIADSVVCLPRFAGHTEHPAAFPVELPKHYIPIYTNPHDVVYEPFGGSGSTIIAAEQSGRRCYSLEITPEYVDIALGRILKELKVVPYRANDGMPFGGEDWLRIPANTHCEAANGSRLAA